MTCTVCPHERRTEIDDALVMGESARSIAKRFGGPSHVAFHRHRDCIREDLRIAREKRGTRLLQRVERLADKLERMADDCEREMREALPDHETEGVTALLVVLKKRAAQATLFLAAARELRPTFHLMGELNGEIVAASVQGFLAALGANNEAEVRSWREVAKAGEAMTLEECEAEGVALLRLVLAEKPEAAGRIVAELGGLPALSPKRNGSPNGHGHD